MINLHPTLIPNFNSVPYHYFTGIVLFIKQSIINLCNVYL